jgi:adenylate cyclase
MAERDRDVPEVRKMQFRIGVNLGDVIVDGSEIYGNGVNVAARLESLANAGGICISGRVLEQVKGNIDVGFASLGAQKVKNIETPVNVYKVLFDPADAGKVIGAPKRHASGWGWVTAAVLALIVAVGGWATWLHVSKPEITPASIEKMAFPLPDKPSIAVLPFDNLSGDPEQEYIADGFTETLLDTLSQIPELFVIARNSTFTYKGKPVRVQQVAEEQGVRYVLEGSMQRSADRIRVTAQLIDAIEGHHLWSHRYDRSFDDLFKIQDEITLKIAEALRLELIEGEQPAGKAPITNVEAWSKYVKALSLQRKGNKEDNAHARKLVQEALALEPESSSLWNLLGWTHLVDARRMFTDSPEESMKLAQVSAERALSLAPDSPHPHNLLGAIYVHRGDFDRGLAEKRKALELGPYSADILGSAAYAIFLAGDHEEVVDLETRAMRLSPFYPTWHLMLLSRSLTFLRRYDEAIEVARKGVERAESANNESVHRVSLAFAYADRGDLDLARQEMKEALRLRPNLTVQPFLRYWHFTEEADRKRLGAALREAGMPEGQ